VTLEPPRVKSCTCCGSTLGDPETVGHRVVEEISNPAPRMVIDYLEHGYTCSECGAVTPSRHPDCPPEGLFGKNVHVQATLLKFRDRLPLRKTAETMNRSYGLEVSPATVLGILHRVARWLRPEYIRVLMRIRSAGVVYVDETGLKVDGVGHWIWSFTAGTDTIVAVRRSRGKKVLEEILGKDFRGAIVCDGLRSYPNFTDRIQRCWSHLLREADHLAEHVKEAVPLAGSLHMLYGRVKPWSVDKPPPEVAAMLEEEGRRTMIRLAGMPWRDERTRKLVGKMMNGLDHWYTFLWLPSCEPTNNRAERALREHVVQRKIMGCLRNGKGTWIYETVMSVLSTWSQQGKDLPETLAETLTKEWKNS
jgi:transposase